MNRATILSVPVVITSCAGCGGSPVDPSPATTVTFLVANERFRVSLTGDDQIATARAAQAGGPAHIPMGRIVRGTQANMGWSWHLEDVGHIDPR